MHIDLSTLPNRLTFARILLLPVLWALALTGRTTALGIAIAVVSTTDVLDGWIARRFDQTSDAGSRLDTIADTALMLSILVWLFLLRPEFMREQAIPLLAWAAIGLAALLLGWLRFRRTWDLHLYTSKAGAFLGYVFVVTLFILGDYPGWLFALAIGASILGAVETLLVYATARRVHERIGSILFLRHR